MSLKSISKDLAGSVHDDAPADFLLAYDAEGSETDDLDDATYTVLVAPFAGGYRSQLEIFNGPGSAIHEHTMDTDGLDLPKLTREIAVGEAGLILEHMYESHHYRTDVDREQMRHVFVQAGSCKVWGVRPVEVLGCGAENLDVEIGGGVYARLRNYASCDRSEVGVTGYHIYLVPKTVADALSAEDAKIAELFRYQGGVQVTMREDAIPY